MTRTVALLRASVTGYEEAYHCSSIIMLKKVRAGKVAETVEIGKWLTDYHVLSRLEGQYGPMIGASMKNTKQFTTDT